MRCTLHGILFNFLTMASSIDTQVKQIKEYIKKNTLAPIYLLKGDEAYYIDLICNEFETKLINPSDRDFNQTVIYGKEATAQQLITLCRQFPFMGDKQLVILKEAQLMPKNEWEDFAIYLNKPLSSTILVICYKSQKFVDVKTKNIITKQGGVVIESAKIKDHNVPSWITSYIKSINFTIDDGGVDILCGLLGNNLQNIANEINKLILNLNGRTHITTADIQEFIGISKDYNVFELQKALGLKDAVKANTIINYFEKNPKDNPIQVILPILFAYFVKLLIASQLPLKNSNTIAGALGISSYFAKDYITPLNFYNTEQLLNIISLFNEYDLKSKGIGVSPLKTDAGLMKELVFKIIHI